MTDDPRDIIKAAGVECAEVEALFEEPLIVPIRSPEFGTVDIKVYSRQPPYDAAILALARLAAKYKWQVGEAWEMVPPQDELPSFPESQNEWFSELDQRWDELS